MNTTLLNTTLPEQVNVLLAGQGPVGATGPALPRRYGVRDCDSTSCSSAAWAGETRSHGSSLDFAVPVDQ